METSTATARAAGVAAIERRIAPTKANVLWALAGLTALGFALRFATLGVQSYHHDEVITAGRVIPGSFLHMLDQVKASESNPPLYYVLAWGWAKVFGTGEGALRSLSAMFGVATIPVAFLVGRELASRRAGLIAAAIVAVNPMLIWYSQEARSYALLVFFGALALLFMARALRRGGSTADLALWALSSALALCSHYFAAFAIAIEAIWLLIALPGRRTAALAAIAGVGAVGLALLPLLLWQSNPQHIGWIDERLLSTRLFETGVSFLIGETGHVIAEPPREGFALLPAALVGLSVWLLGIRTSRKERHAAAPALAVGLGVVALATVTALLGKDYVVQRNLLPALVPLAAALAIGLAVRRPRHVGLLCAATLCAYWLAFDVYVALTPNLQRPDFRTLTSQLGQPARPRAIVGWRLAVDPIRFYLHDSSQRSNGGKTSLAEIATVSKPRPGVPANLPAGFREVAKIRLNRLTLTRYMAPQPRLVPFHALRDIRTGFAVNGVVLDGQIQPQHRE